MKTLSRGASYLPSAGAQEESDGEQCRPAGVSKAFTLVRLHLQGFTFTDELIDGKFYLAAKPELLGRTKKELS